MAFERLDPSIRQNKQLVAFDLPFHGKTEWNKADCSREDIAQIIRLLQDRAHQTTCALLGFSLGGRIALSLWPDLKDRIESLILLAPDGIRTKGLAFPEAFPISIRKVIRRGILFSARATRLIQWVGSQHWLPDVSTRFIRRQMSTPEKLNATLHWWVSLADFQVSNSMIRQMTASDPLPVQIWVGSRDPFISVRDIHKFWQDYPSLEIKEIPGKGHRVGFINQ